MPRARNKPKKKPAKRKPAAKKAGVARKTTSKKKPAGKKQPAKKKAPSRKAAVKKKPAVKKASSNKKSVPAKKKSTAGKKSSSRKSTARKKPTARKKSATANAKPRRKPAPKKKSGTKKKASSRKSPSRKKAASKKPAAKKPSKKASKKPATKRKTKKVSASRPSYASRSHGRSTDVVRVRARFTEPLRRFGEFENLRDLIHGQAQKYGDRTFLIFEDDGREYSFARLDEITNRTANILHELGGVKGARVALLMENSPDFVFSFLGAMKAGLIAVPLNLDLTDDQLRFQLEDCGANFAIVSARVWERLQPLLEDLPGLMDVLVAGQHDVLGAPEGATYKLHDYQQALDTTDGSTISTPEITWWDEAQIVYTGQHLDQPHGAILQHRQFMTAARWLSIWLKLDENQRFMSGLPLFHANAQVVTLFTPLQMGGSVVLSREFNATRLWKAVERYKVTTLSAVPSMLGILADREVSEARGAKPAAQSVWPAPHESPGTLNQRDDHDARERGLARGHDISSLERVISGAAPLPAAIHKIFEQIFLVPVIEGYSMAETTCFAMLNPGIGTRKIGSVGVAVGDKVAVQDDNNPPRPLEDWGPKSFLRMNPPVFPTAPLGEQGEICVWGENVLKEYFHRPNLNPEAFAGGWFHTGDVGHQDSDGFYYIHGLKDEVIDTGEVRYMPREVDELLFGHSQVEQAATVSNPDPHKGSLVTTWVVMRKGTFPGGMEEGRLPHNEEQSETMRREIFNYIERNLEAKKRPTTVRFAHRLPRDTTGKTRVIELKRLAQEGAEEE